MKFESLPLHIVLSESDLATFLDKAGSPFPISIRQGLQSNDELTPDAKKILFEGHLIDAEGESSARLTVEGETLANVLLCPRTMIGLEIFGKRTITGRMNIVFPDTPAAGVGVIANKEGDDHHISAFADADILLDVLSEILPPDVKAKVPQFEATLDLPQAIVLCAIIDYLAQICLEKLQLRVMRGQEPETLNIPMEPFSVEDIVRHIEYWWGMSRADQLLGQLFAQFLKPDVPPKAHVLSVIRAFKDVGIIDEANLGVFKVTQTLKQLVAEATIIIGGFSWDRITYEQDGELQGDARRYLISENALVFGFELLGEEFVRLKLENGDSLRSFFAEEFVGSATSEAQQIRPSEADFLSSTLITQAEKKNAQRQLQNFCTECGSRLSPDDKFCTQCGAQLAL